MNEILEEITKALFTIGEFVSLILEIISVICIVTGLFLSLTLAFKIMKETKTPMHNRVRLKFGGWLALALEFQLASDIIKTTVNPTYENLLIVGVVAVIRTFLNYFLNRELREEMEMTKEFEKSKT